MREVKSLQMLVNLPVSDVTHAFGTLTLQFDERATLAIYNRLSVSKPVGEIIGQKVLLIEESSDEIRITFDGGDCIAIGMADSDYNGPEAMLLIGFGDAIVAF